jgi:PTS system nitrogen regulatory IIA component
MKLNQLLSAEDILPRLKATDKLSVLKEMVDHVAKRHAGISAQDVLKVLLEREKLGSTGTGNGVAIPHGKADSLDELLVCFGRSAQGIDFESMDDKPAYLFFLLVAPANSIGTHLSALARISNLLNDDDARGRLLKADTEKSIFEIIESFDESLGEGR